MNLRGVFERWFEFALSKKAEIIHMSILFKHGEGFGLPNTNGLECLKEFVQLSNIPKLTKLDLRDFTDRLTQVEFLDGMPSCIRDQLQLLRLTSRPVSMYKRNFELLNDLSIQLVNIKHLQLELNLYDTKYYISRYTHRLVEVCGSLEKLVIKFLSEPLWRLLGEEGKTETYNHPERELSQKYLEISGYSGSDLEREFTLDLINNTTTHLKVIVVACDEESLARARLDFEDIKLVSFLVI
ncbi:hypothetical protein AAHA92_24947 [Salvia divinorum]|uniref:Uncharacterized protein n=1 Tax=Salvia divinorum TaxID=28513 RepID=A0ABD1G908_SALDI